MSVANNLELLSSLGLYHQSVASGSRGSRSHHSRDHHNSGSGSDRDNMGDGDDINSHHPSRNSRFESYTPVLDLMLAMVGQIKEAMLKRDPKPLQDQETKAPRF